MTRPVTSTRSPRRAPSWWPDQAPGAGGRAAQAAGQLLKVTTLMRLSQTVTATREAVRAVVREAEALPEHDAAEPMAEAGPSTTL
jgi:hypothetical protein